MLIPSILSEVRRVYATDAVRPTLAERARAGNAPPPRQFDSVTLSRSGERLAAALRAALAAPEARQDLVARIRATIDSGTYSLRAKDVAEVLLKGDDKP